MKKKRFMSETTTKPFDLLDPIKIKDQIKAELTRRSIPYIEFCDFCKIDKFHFYNHETSDSRTIVVLRKLVAFVKKHDPSFELDYYNPTHLMSQITNKCAELGFKNMQVCRAIKIPARSLYFNEPEIKALGFLRDAVKFFNRS